MLIERVEMYVVAGMPISDAISQAGQGLGSKQRLSIEKVCVLVEGGQLLSMLFAQELKFPAVVVGIIACGESSGSLAQALKSGHLLLEKEDELIKKCTSAMTYPCVIAFAAGALTIGLVRGIMPQITPLLIGLHGDLPLLTKIVMKMSDLLLAYGIWVVIRTVICSLGMVWVYRKTTILKTIIHSSSVKVPLLGVLIENYALAVFFQSIASLVESGMSADRAYGRSSNTVSLIPLRKRLLAATDKLSNGGSFEDIFVKDMPAFIAPLIAAGEASGSLNLAFYRAAVILERELDHSLKRMTALIEPVMMIFMGCTVGAIALSIMMPIYGISKALQH